VNRLKGESSPYLLQHAHNPVDWYPWGREALDRAMAEDKPILVSIGYAACHWCHVMERESFEQPETAALMNAHFINIKIDREERPDLDHIYMDALQVMTGSGGWPLNVFLTPDRRPFFGGTYFPPVNAYGRPSWRETLEQVTRAFGERRPDVEAQAAQLTEHLSVSNAFGLLDKPIPPAPGEALVSKTRLEDIFTALMQQADREAGGFGRPPKFPQTFSLQWLLHFAHFTGNKEALDHACNSLDHLLQGGIYDQLGGGMARYSTDRTWLVPHFEKMLYDNALLVSTLCEAYGLTREPRYKVAIDGILSFVLREWETDEGGFCSAWDADSEGEEGKFYTWSWEEVTSLLGEDAAAFCTFYDITPEGNWEGVNIPHRTVSPGTFAFGEIARSNGWQPEEMEALLESGKRRLLEARGKRIRPLLDDKQLLNWNALINKAFSQAYAVTGEPVYRETARKHMDFLLKAFQPREEQSTDIQPGAGQPMNIQPGTGQPPTNIQPGGLGHTYKEGILRYPAFLDDYANLVEALLRLQEITADPRYLILARDWTEYVIQHFSEAETGFFYYTHEGQKDILFRKKEVYDGATPSGNAVMAWNLSYLSVVFDRKDWGARAGGMLQGMLPVIGRYPSSFGVWADLALTVHYGLSEIVVVGDQYAPLLKEVLGRYIPNKVLQGAGEGIGGFPLLAGKGVEGVTLIYLCRNYACGAPVKDPDALMAQLNGKNI
jgi:uncharacterized protein YyaL (SSP411 family)